MKVIESFFEELNASGCTYFSFKGYHHLKEDINNDNGDIDIFVSDNSFSDFELIAFKFGFYKATNRNSNVHQYYGKLNGKLIMLDVVTKIPYLDESLHDDLKSSIRDFRVNSLVNEDMIAYGFIYLYYQGDVNKYKSFFNYYLKVRPSAAASATASARSADVRGLLHARTARIQRPQRHSRKARQPWTPRYARLTRPPTTTRFRCPRDARHASSSSL